MANRDASSCGVSPGNANAFPSQESRAEPPRHPSRFPHSTRFFKDIPYLVETLAPRFLDCQENRNACVAGVVSSESCPEIAFSAGSATPLTVPKSGEGELVLVCSPPSEGPFTGAATIALTGDTAVPTLTYSLTAQGVIVPPAAAGSAWVMYY
jgi:hypothetical protein